MNELARHNAALRAEVDAYASAKTAVQTPRLTDYPLPALKARITQALSGSDRGPLNPHFEIVARAKFGADLAVRIPELLSRGGPKTYIAEHLPWIVETLSGAGFADAIQRVEAKGIYVNLRLADGWFLAASDAIARAGERYGLNDSHAGRTAVIDYSSPNVAKMLHAGHIRSTIIGHVLGNLYEGSGAKVYRLNHINDFGGFGFVLEGWRRFAETFPAELDANGRLLEIYAIRRSVERVVASPSWDAAPAEDRERLVRYFPDVDSLDDAKAASAAFTAASDARFEQLEAGDAEEVELWKQAVAWSLGDFETFYDSLRIHIDQTIGESFYFAAGDALVDACLADGRAVLFDRSHAEPLIAEIRRRLQAGEISQGEADQRVGAIEKDIGAVVVPLPDGERYVVRRADGRSIYATRDLGAIALRGEIFHPTDIVYVVGQEQRVHFERLFQAARAIGVAGPELNLYHLWFGFYVDARTGKKLSSRSSVSNVNHLLEASIQHFRDRYSGRMEQSDEELEEAAQQLAIGSLVFNDLKQDVRGPVEIGTDNLQETIEGFERSGGAYVVYAACRARSIMRRWQRPLPSAEGLSYGFDDQEVALMLQLMEVPERVARATAQNEPSLLVRHLLEVATTYNSYYMRAPVLKDGAANEPRLLITQAVQNALVSGLALCHVTCPPNI